MKSGCLTVGWWWRMRKEDRKSVVMNWCEQRDFLNHTFSWRLGGVIAGFTSGSSKLSRKMNALVVWMSVFEWKRMKENSSSTTQKILSQLLNSTWLNISSITVRMDVCIAEILMRKVTQTCGMWCDHVYAWNRATSIWKGNDWHDRMFMRNFGRWRINKNTMLCARFDTLCIGDYTTVSMISTG